MNPINSELGIIDLVIASQFYYNMYRNNTDNEVTELLTTLVSKTDRTNQLLEMILEEMKNEHSPY